MRWDRASIAGGFLTLLGSAFILFRRWWVRDRFDRLRNLTRWSPSVHQRQEAAETAQWYDEHRAAGERRFAVAGFALVVLCVVLLLLRMSGRLPLLTTGLP